MTNEKLAALAQDPDNKELVPVLWDKVKDLLYMKANRAYRQHSDMFARCGVELADIRQSCYIVFLDALKGYQPDGETKFTSYLNYPFQTMLKELTHTRTSRKEPLNDATSLDKPIQDKDGDADATMVDLLPDSSIDLENDVLDPLERDEEQQVVRDAVARLPEQQRNVIESTYFLNQAQKEIAARMGCRPQNVHRLQVQAFQTLRRSPILQRLYREQVKHYQWQQVQRLENRPEFFEIVQQLRERQEQGEPISYGKYQARLYSVYLDAVRIAEARRIEESNL